MSLAGSIIVPHLPMIVPAEGCEWEDAARKTMNAYRDAREPYTLQRFEVVKHT